MNFFNLQKPFYNDKKNIVLVGETGQGKSTLGNFLLKKKVFEVSSKSKSCTAETVIEDSEQDNIQVIDTPGLKDSEGRDATYFEKMTKSLKNEIKNLHLIVVVLNFQNPRLDITIKKMIEKLCKVFPKHLAYHIAIVFTHYYIDVQEKDDEDEEDEDNFLDPRQIRITDYVPSLMKIISSCTGEPLLLTPPVFFMNCKKKPDLETISERDRLIALAQNYEPIKDIVVTSYNSCKKVDYEYDVKTEDKGDEIWIIKLRCKKYIYDNGDTKLDNKWEVFSTDKIKKNNEKAINHNNINQTKKQNEVSLCDQIGNFINLYIHCYGSMKYQEEREERAEKIGQKYGFKDRFHDIIIGWSKVDETIEKLGNKNKMKNSLKYK